MRLGLLRLLSSLFPTDATFLEAENGWQAIDLLQAHSDVNLVLLDVQMPQLNGIDTLREMRKRGWKTPVVVLTQYEEQSLVEQMRRLKISAFLTKNCKPEELKAAISVAAAGGTYFNDLMPGETTMPDTADLTLTSREQEIVRLLARGKTSVEIANQLKLSVETVSEHRQRIMSKTNTHNVAELIGLAARTGLL